MPYGRGPLGNTPNEIERSYEQTEGAVLFGDEDDADVNRVPAFEMQRQSAKDYQVNKKVQTTAKAKLAATNTFRQRVPSYAGPRVRGIGRRKYAGRIKWIPKTSMSVKRVFARRWPGSVPR